MNKITSKKQSIKKNTLLLTFFVLFSLVISENVFAIKHWEDELVDVSWEAHSNSIIINTEFYAYPFGQEAEHSYLRWCQFKYSNGKEDYKILMEYFTNRQNYSNKSNVILVNKFMNAQIEFLQNVTILPAGAKWPEHRKRLDLSVLNSQKKASLSIKWHLGNKFKDVRYIRISGVWNIDAPYQCEPFNDVVYEIKKNGQPVLKSNAPNINTTVSNNKPVKVFNKSSNIEIKGADIGTNMKVYNPSGVEIKSVISNKRCR